MCVYNIHTICLNFKYYNYKYVIKLSIYFGKHLILHICKFFCIIDYIFKTMVNRYFNKILV